MKQNSENPLRLLFILDEPTVKTGGGAETHAFNLAKYLVSRGCPVLILVPQACSWQIQNKAQDGYKIYYLGVPLSKSHLLFSFLYNLRLGLILFTKSGQYDIIHVHGARGLKTVAIVSKLIRKRALITIVRRLHWLFIFRKDAKNIFHKISNRLISFFCGYIAISIDIKNLILSYNIRPDKIFYIPNGIEIQPQYRDKQTLRRKLDLPLASLVALCVGRLHWQKNIPFLLHAWAMVVPKVPDARLILLGDGPMRPEIESLIAAQNLEPSVACRGFVHNIFEYLQAADIFVLPSRMEGCPMALLEAMGWQMACIVTDSPGNDEIIVHNVNGFLVQFGNTGQFAGYILNLLTDHGLRHRLGTGAHQCIRERFMIQQICDRHLECYQQISS